MTLHLQVGERERERLKRNMKIGANRVALTSHCLLCSAPGLKALRDSAELYICCALLHANSAEFTGLLYAAAHKFTLWCAAVHESVLMCTAVYKVAETMKREPSTRFTEERRERVLQRENGGKVKRGRWWWEASLSP